MSTIAHPTVRLPDLDAEHRFKQATVDRIDLDHMLRRVITNARQGKPPTTEDADACNAVLASILGHLDPVDLAYRTGRHARVSA